MARVEVGEDDDVELEALDLVDAGDADARANVEPAARDQAGRQHTGEQRVQARGVLEVATQRYPGVVAERKQGVGERGDEVAGLVVARDEAKSGVLAVGSGFGRCLAA